MEQIRSFIAVELPDELRQGLGRLQSRLKNQPSVKWVDPRGIHLTLKFLGNIDADSTGEITAAMEEATAGISPFRLEVSGLGVFPSPAQARVAWVGLRGDTDSLVRLQQRLEENLARLGFAPEPRPFTPHLTLARVREGVSPGAGREFGQAITGASLDMEYAIEVSAISLMRSQLTRQGAIYSRISLVRLG